MMSETDSETVNVEQYANETVRLTTAITRVMNAPDIVTGEVSGSGKTIAVDHPNREGKTFRLDTATIMAGDSEFRDSRSFSLYTREDFQNTQSANYGPGPQAGANGVSDSEDLPEPTHTPVGQDGEDADEDSDDDPDADGDASEGEDTEDGRDEFGRIREGERVHLTGETEDGETLDARGTVKVVSGAGTTVELDDGRMVRKKASVIKARSPEGVPLYFRKPEMEHITEGEEPGSEDANPGDEGGQTVMTDGGKPVSEYDADSTNAYRGHDEVELFHLLELIREGDEVNVNRRRRTLTATRVTDSATDRVVTLKGNGTTYSLILTREDGEPVDATLQYPSGSEELEHLHVANRNALHISEYDQLLPEELETVAAGEHVDRMMGFVERSPDRTWSDLSERDRTGEWSVDGAELTAVKWAIHAFMADYREGGKMGGSDTTLDRYQDALALWERVRGEREQAWFVGSEFGLIGAYLDYSVEDPDIRARIPEAVVDAVDALRRGEDVPDITRDSRVSHPEDATCPACGGDGQVYEGQSIIQCPDCGGEDPATDGGEPVMMTDGGERGIPPEQASEGDSIRVVYDSPRSDEPQTREGKVLEIERWETDAADGEVDTIRFLTPSRECRVRFAPSGGHIVEQKSEQWTKLGRSTSLTVTTERAPDGGEWDPEPATLRDGETEDADSHAARNAEMLEQARREGITGGEEPDDDGANPGGEPMTDGGMDAVDADELSEGERVTVECTRLPIRDADEFPREVTGEVTSVDHMDTREFRETGEVVISASSGTYTLTYEPGIMTLATGEGDGEGQVFGDVTALTRAPEVWTDGGSPEDPEGEDAAGDAVDAFADSITNLMTGFSDVEPDEEYTTEIRLFIRNREGDDPKVAVSGFTVIPPEEHEQMEREVLDRVDLRKAPKPDGSRARAKTVDIGTITFLGTGEILETDIASEYLKPSERGDSDE